MSLFSMLRRPSYTALSHGVRAVRSARTFHRAVSTVPTFTPSLVQRSFVPTHRFCTAAAVEPVGDQRLIGVLESEIKCAEEDKLPTPERPDEFPFEIVDNPGDSTILLKREFEGETIQVCVDIPNSVNNDADIPEDDDHLKYKDPGIPIVVSISKANGQQLEVGITGFEEELSIDSLSIKHPGDCSEDMAYDGPEFQDLDESLQKAFYKYLNDRGIKEDMMIFLYDYLENKDNKEYKLWLKNLKSFIEQ